MKLKESLSTLKAYVAGKSKNNKRIIKLNANECPYDVPDKIYRKAFKVKNVNRYHEPSGAFLRNKIAKELHLDNSNIILGNGSGELIKTFLEAFCEKDSKVIMPEITFSLYQLYSVINENQIIKIPSNSNYGLNLDAMIESIDEKTKVIFICNPNNPTGHSYDYKTLEKVFKNIPDNVGIFLDEAYINYSIHYSSSKTKKMIHDFKNLFILRTFSKIGLAGIRIGYGVGEKSMIESLHSVRPPFNTNIFAQKMAYFLLKEKSYIQKIVKNNQKQKKYLMKQLSQLGFIVYDSDANFILVKAVPELDKMLEKLGILIRKTQSFGLPADYYRITIGKPKENKALVKGIREVLS